MFHDQTERNFPLNKTIFRRVSRIENKNGRSTLNSIGIEGLATDAQRNMITAVAAAASDPKNEIFIEEMRENIQPVCLSFSYSIGFKRQKISQKTMFDFVEILEYKIKTIDSLGIRLARRLPCRILHTWSLPLLQQLLNLRRISENEIMRNKLSSK